jgi:hypothetical protein
MALGLSVLGFTNPNVRDLKLRSGIVWAGQDCTDSYSRLVRALLLGDHLVGLFLFVSIYIMLCFSRSYTVHINGPLVQAYGAWACNLKSAQAVKIFFFVYGDCASAVPHPFAKSLLSVPRPRLTPTCARSALRDGGNHAHHMQQRLLQGAAAQGPAPRRSLRLRLQRQNSSSEIFTCLWLTRQRHPKISDAPKISIHQRKIS